MKKIWSVFVLIAAVNFTHAQPAASLQALLGSYYNVKDALVAGDAAKAAAQAAALEKALGTVNTATLNSAAQEALKNVQADITAAAKTIAASKDISKQRESFVQLSEKFTALAKTVKLSAQPVYLDYCPMKKAYWLSADQAVKNPYYGSSMLSCGSVKEILK